MKRRIKKNIELKASLSHQPKELNEENIRDLLVKMANDESEGYITTINVGEVYYMISRKRNTKSADLALDALLKFPFHIIEADLKLILEAAKLKAKYSLSYADAFAAALTINRNAILITGDNEFENLTKEAGFKVKYL